MSKCKSILKKVLGLFVLLIVATFASIFTISEINSNVNSELSDDKYIEDPEDEDYGGVGVFSYKPDESESA